MITPEQLIYDLQSQIIKLEKELDQAQTDIRDFEVLAIEWKKGHRELEAKYKVKLMEKDQIIKELENDLKDAWAKSVGFEF